MSERSYLYDKVTATTESKSRNALPTYPIRSCSMGMYLTCVEYYQVYTYTLLNMFDLVKAYNIIVLSDSKQTVDIVSTSSTVLGP